MYVCLCNGFRDRELKALGAGGVRCARAAYEILGGEPKCGACLDTARTVLEEACGANDRECLETEAA